jgi:hypothetical protein
MVPTTYDSWCLQVNALIKIERVDDNWSRSTLLWEETWE